MVAGLFFRSRSKEACKGSSREFHQGFLGFALRGYRVKLKSAGSLRLALDARYGSFEDDP